MRNRGSRTGRGTLLVILGVLVLFLAGRILKGSGSGRAPRHPVAPERTPKPGVDPVPAPPPQAGSVVPPSPTVHPLRLQARLEFEDNRQPVPAGITVACRGAAESPRSVTDATGSVVLENMPGPGPHTILIDGDAFGVGKRELEVTVPRDGAPVVWTLERRTVFRGTVRSTDGRPLAGASVSIRAETSGATECTTATTGEEGAFRIEVGAVTGPVTLGAHGIAGYAPTPGTPVEITPSLREVGIEMPPATVISGRLVDQEGKPLPAWPFRLLVFQPEAPSADLFPWVFTPASTPVAGRKDGVITVVHSFHMRTDERGAFRFTPFLPARVVLVMAEKEGCRPVVRSLRDLAAGDRLDRDLGDLALSPPDRPLRFQVLLPDGKPATRMRVSFELVLPDADRTMASAECRTDADGWASSPFLEEGSTYLLFPGGGWEGPQPRFEARDGARITLERMPFPEKGGTPGDGR